MPPTPFSPLKALKSWYDDTDGHVAITIYLLDGTVTQLLDAYDTIDDLPGAVASTGAYDASTGIDAGDWPLNYDPDIGVMELSLPDSGWTSTDSYTLTYRWIVLCLPGGVILNAVDYGSLQTLTNEPLKLHADESTDIPNSYAVYRWRKA